MEWGAVSNEFDNAVSGNSIHLSRSILFVEDEMNSSVNPLSANLSPSLLGSDSMAATASM